MYARDIVNIFRYMIDFSKRVGNVDVWLVRIQSKKIGKVLSREGISYEKVDFEDIGSGMYIISYWTDISKALSQFTL